jgi:GTP-binding protein HflX
LTERLDDGERTILVHILFGTGRRFDGLEELRSLAISAGARPVATVVGQRARPEATYSVGHGKVEQIRDCVQLEHATLVLVNHDLTPSQERNLERTLGCRVLDRTGLILDIFAQRARSFEGKLQVELAQLQHLSTRLIRGWTHLERQKGGIGLRGPGESQLETDRRLIGARIRQLTQGLEKIQRRRHQGRRSRKKAAVRTVSLVGYTNTGKSTLFNRLTAAEVYSADQLFATLDPTLRRLELTGIEPLVLADTVGFIRDLPHDLVAAFHSTLQETSEADLILHVIDAHDPNHGEAIVQVNRVLEEIGAAHVPQIEIYNKIDLLAEPRPDLELDAAGRVARAWVSASTGAGLDLLVDAIAGYFRAELVRVTLCLPPGAARLRARLFESGRVIRERVIEGGCWWIEAEVNPRKLGQMQAHDGLRSEYIVRRRDESAGVDRENLRQRMVHS